MGEWHCIEWVYLIKNWSCLQWVGGNREITLYWMGVQDQKTGLIFNGLTGMQKLTLYWIGLQDQKTGLVFKRVSRNVEMTLYWMGVYDQKRVNRNAKTDIVSRKLKYIGFVTRVLKYVHGNRHHFLQETLICLLSVREIAELDDIWFISNTHTEEFPQALSQVFEKILCKSLLFTSKIVTSLCTIFERINPIYNGIFQVSKTLFLQKCSWITKEHIITDRPMSICSR